MTKQELEKEARKLYRHVYAVCIGNDYSHKDAVIEANKSYIAYFDRFQSNVTQPAPEPVSNADELPEFVYVTHVDEDSIRFNDGSILSSDHLQDCCESHYLSFSDLELSDFDGLLFDISNNSFFERVPGYGIALLPKNGHPVRVPGYGSNNGYYSSNLTLVLIKDNIIIMSDDITECQVIDQ